MYVNQETSVLGMNGNTTELAGFIFGKQGYDAFGRVNGYNVADLAWGTANAKTITLSFWVRSSLTGTFGGSIQNSSQGRSYPYTYTISVANTWEQKSITILGDTSGTWLTTNGNGLWLFFNLGTGTTGSGTAGAWSGGNYQSATGATSVVGTSGATFYITGVQLEVGTEATPFEHLQYTTQLQLCQRYCWSCDQSISLPVKTDTTYAPMVYLPQHMRAIPSLSNASYTVASGSTGTPAISATGVGGIESSENAVWMYNSANNWTVSVNNYVRLTAIFSAEL